MQSFRLYTESTTLERTNILTVYHGSNVRFSHFDPHMLVGGHDAKGPGLYTTTDMDDASKYGQYIYTIRLDPKKFVFPDTRIDKRIIKDVLMASPHLELQASNYDDNHERGVAQLLRSMTAGTTSMHEALERVWYEGYNADTPAYLESVSMWYHGTALIPHEAYHPDVHHYIVWSEKAIKSMHIDNLYDHT